MTQKDKTMGDRETVDPSILDFSSRSVSKRDVPTGKIMNT